MAGELQEHWPRVSIDETALSDGELYTIVSNKDAHGRKGAIIAMVRGTKVEDVVKALKTILWYERAKVLEVTMAHMQNAVLRR